MECENQGEDHDASPKECFVFLLFWSKWCSLPSTNSLQAGTVSHNILMYEQSDLCLRRFPPVFSPHAKQPRSANGLGRVIWGAHNDGSGEGLRRRPRAWA